jgi:hypothetical protein
MGKVPLVIIKHDFWSNDSVHELAQSQEVAPIENIDELCVEAWPVDESTDEFLTTIRSWRKVDAPTCRIREQA